MGKRSKFTAQEKLAIIQECRSKSISAVAKLHAISWATIRKWQLLYKYQGIKGLTDTHCNQSYSKKFKEITVREFLKSDEPITQFAIKHGLRSKNQLRNWIVMYNGFNLKAYTPRKRDSIMPGRKTTFEERLKIIEELIKHDVNYNWAAEKYHISYQQFYG